MKKFNYGSMKWKKKREKILRKDGYKCVVAFTWWNVSDYLSYEPTFCSKYTIIINLYAVFIWLKFLYGKFKKRRM